MTELEQYLRNHTIDVDTWVDSDGLHVLDKETNQCLLFDAIETLILKCIIYVKNY